ncbi:lipid-A-disaccharide synthase [Dongshaea marina]|uniref:lipid-A-disaccharide synthase n=1 Tax=Dongshaea marina TaxID=2047966 RepID=UPI000D3E5ADC|nr:lipid-A-disaccharide synthase [Dongshaea marina]
MSNTANTSASGPLRIAIVAGELSGDILGAGLIKEIKQRHPDAIIEGIAGPRMVEQGCKALFDIDELSVMGVVEIIGRLPSILKIRRQLLKHLIANPPDIFIGIDAPEFNLGVEARLKKSGITTVHYASPKVWAWRQKRVFKIRKAVDLMLVFMPFEKAFYDRFGVPCKFIGHTLADQIPLNMDKAAARERLGVKHPADHYIAVLPGSRNAEVELLSPTFVRACKHLTVHFPNLRFAVPLVNEKRKQQFLKLAAEFAPTVEFECFDGKARDVMAASDVVLLASGTATLEAMLVGRPMVVCYRLKAFTYYLAQKLVHTPYVSLPNLLADQMLVPELIQHQCEPERIVTEVTRLLEHDNQWLKQKFTQLHQQLRCNADEQAAEAVLELIKTPRNP